MSSDVAIRAEGLGKAYTIRHQQSDHVTLTQVALERVRHPLRRQAREQFWALQDVSFEVRSGEVLGVIGRNGAGKSTLLKLLARITGPTTGRIDLWGRVGSLLEVGTGFHPELTGRENVYLNGSILGMRRKEIDRQFDAIVDFAGVEKFLDTPVKRYSSGMYVRLAFAVAAHLETEILLVDEVLAVGDTAFQQKCLGKIHDVAVGGRTVLFVSHQLSSVSALCDRTLVIDRGRVDFIGLTDDAVARYQASIHFATQTDPHFGTGQLTIRGVSMEADIVGPTDEKRITFTVDPVLDSAPTYYVTVRIFDERGNVVVFCDSRLVGLWLDPRQSQAVTLVVRHPWLLPGRYRVDLRVCSTGVIEALEGACTFTVAEGLPYPGSAPREALALSTVLSDFDITASAVTATSAAGTSAAADEDRVR